LIGRYVGDSTLPPARRGAYDSVRKGSGRWRGSLPEVAAQASRAGTQDASCPGVSGSAKRRTPITSRFSPCCCDRGAASRVQVWSCGAADGRMGIESSQLRSIKTSSKALGCCILIAANLQMSRQICKRRDKSAHCRGKYANSTPGAGTGKRANLKNWCGVSRFRVRVAVGGPMPSWRNEQRRGLLSPRLRV